MRLFAVVVFLLCLPLKLVLAGDSWLVVDGPNYVMKVRPYAMGMIPLSMDPSDRSAVGMAAMAADAGSRYFQYIRGTQHEVEWRGVELLPDDLEEGNFEWSRHQKLALVSANSDTVEVVDLALTTGCTAGWAGCFPLRALTGVSASWVDLLVPMGKKKPRIRGYVGVKRGSLRGDAVGVVWVN